MMLENSPRSTDDMEPHFDGGHIVVATESGLNQPRKDPVERYCCPEGTGGTHTHTQTHIHVYFTNRELGTSISGHFKNTKI